MQAIVQDHYGSAPEEVLRLADVPPPVPEDDDVLVRVRGSSVDRGTWHVMAGLPYPIRVAGFGVRRPQALTPGRSLAGTVERVGPKVTGLAAGDEVYGTAAGAFAEYVCAKASRLATGPATLTFEQAAAVPISGLTALQAVRDHGKVQSGQQVLVLGASGGVGTFAVQIAKAFDAEVTGVCSTTKVDLVRSLGADRVIDYTEDDVTQDGRRYDVILDIGGNRPLAHLRRILTPRGTLVIVGGEGGGRWLGGNDRQLRAMLLSPFVGQKLGTFVSREKAVDLTTLRDLIDSGRVTPTIERTYSLAETATAVRHVQDGRARGKVAIAI
jgi:NADPH:quinone reductase-like Zn-dependent oxidoreductase